MTAAEPKRLVILYRDDWLPPSEGFVVEPSLHFARYGTRFAGLTRHPVDHPLVDPAAVQRWEGEVDPRALIRLRRRGFPPGWWRDRLGSDATVVHAHFGPDALIARHIARELQVPLAVSMHGYDVTERDYELLRYSTGRSYLLGKKPLRRAASLFLPVSNYLRAEMIRKGWPADRTIRHYIGVDTDFWSPSRQGGGEDVLFVGRLSPLKGADLLIRAFGEVADRHREAKLHIVGDGPERSRCESLARGLGSRVQFHGAAPRALIRSLMHSSRVVVVPSREARGRREAFNLVSLEAAACGLPVIASKSGGLPEAVQEGVTGLLFPEDDQQGLEVALHRVLAQPALAEDLGAAGRERTRTCFDIRAQAHVLEDHYDRLKGGDQ